MGRPKNEGLTTVELNVLTALAHNETIADAARALDKSPSTVRNQLHAIYKKLGVHGPIEAYHKVGWLRPPPPPEPLNEI